LGAVEAYLGSMIGLGLDSQPLYCLA